MSRGMTKAERLREMERLYYQHGYTDIEMAKRLGVDRTVVFRDRRELSREIPIIKRADGRWVIDRGAYLSNIRVTRNEALALYLAARRALQQTHLAQPHVANALEKLAIALKQPMMEELTKTAEAILRQQASPERIKIFERVAEAWNERRILRISYRSLSASKPRRHEIAPYLIEPSLWSDSVYLIGRSKTGREILTFKLERIEEAFVSGEEFTIPEDFDEQELLRHAWGIWTKEGEPVTVRLRFTSERAARRLRESIWHPLENVTDTEDGGCIWEAPIAEWREMLPWIRGWGADVEVLEPEELRETLMGETKAMAEQYGWFVSSLPTDESSTLDEFFGG